MWLNEVQIVKLLLQTTLGNIKKLLNYLYLFPLQLTGPNTQYSAVQLGTVKYGVVQLGTVKYGTVQLGTVKYGAVQLGTVKYGAVQLGTVKYGLVQ